MRIRWTMPAAEDLESIKSYLEQQSPHFAEATVRTIYQRIRFCKHCQTVVDPVAVPARESLS